VFAHVRRAAMLHWAGCVAYCGGLDNKARERPAYCGHPAHTLTGLHQRRSFPTCVAGIGAQPEQPLSTAVTHAWPLPFGETQPAIVGYASAMTHRQPWNSSTQQDNSPPVALDSSIRASKPGHPALLPGSSCRSQSGTSQVSVIFAAQAEPSGS